MLGWEYQVESAAGRGVRERKKQEGLSMAGREPRALSPPVKTSCGYSGGLLSLVSGRGRMTAIPRADPRPCSGVAHHRRQHGHFQRQTELQGRGHGSQISRLPATLIVPVYPQSKRKLFFSSILQSPLRVKGR